MQMLLCEVSQNLSQHGDSVGLQTLGWGNIWRFGKCRLGVGVRFGEERDSNRVQGPRVHQLKAGVSNSFVIEVRCDTNETFSGQHMWVMKCNAR